MLMFNRILIQRYSIKVVGEAEVEEGCWNLMHQDCQSICVLAQSLGKVSSNGSIQFLIQVMSVIVQRMNCPTQH